MVSLEKAVKALEAAKAGAAKAAQAAQAAKAYAAKAAKALEAVKAKAVKAKAVKAKGAQGRKPKPLCPSYGINDPRTLREREHAEHINWYIRRKEAWPEDRGFIPWGKRNQEVETNRALRTEHLRKYKTRRDSYNADVAEYKARAASDD